MSDKKMIIRNCPCFIEGIAIKGLEQKTQTCNNHKVRGLKYCAGITDCKLKQIVDKCRNIDCPCEYQGIDCWECSRIGAKTFADSIIELLDIQEV